MVGMTVKVTPVSAPPTASDVLRLSLPAVPVVSPWEIVRDALDEGAM